VEIIAKKLFPTEASRPDPNVIVTDGWFYRDNGMFRVAPP
jgi:hypothetical protein